MKQQTIIIIGATSGIGKTLFEKYAADGNRIGIVGRRTHLLDELRQEHPDMTVTATADKGHGDRYIGSLFRVDEPVPDDSRNYIQSSEPPNMVCRYLILYFQHPTTVKNHLHFHTFLPKSLHNPNKCLTFATPEPAKPLNDAQMSGSFFYCHDNKNTI